MSKDDDRLARLGRSFEEADAELVRKRAEEAAVKRAADQAEAERLSLANKHLPETERGILSLFSEVNRDVFQGRGEVSEWQEIFHDLDDEDHSVVAKWFCRELHLNLNDHRFHYNIQIVTRMPMPGSWLRVMTMEVGKEKIGLEEDSKVVVEKVREDLLEKIESRFGKK